MDTGIPIDTVIWFMGIMSGLIIGTFSLLLKMLLKAQREKITAEINSLKEKLESSDKSKEKIWEMIEKIRDQWVEFQKTATAVESDRGRRLDALFSVVDNLKEGFVTLSRDLRDRRYE